MNGDAITKTTRLEVNNRAKAEKRVPRVEVKRLLTKAERKSKLCLSRQEEEVKSEDDTFDLLTQRKETLAEGMTAHSIFSPPLSEFDDNSKSPKPYYFNDDNLTTNNPVMTPPQLNTRDLFGSFDSSGEESSSSESEMGDKSDTVFSNKSRSNSVSDNATSPADFVYEEDPSLSTVTTDDVMPHKNLESPKVSRRDDIVKMKLAHIKEAPVKSPAASEEVKDTTTARRHNNETKHKNGVKKKKFELANFIKKSETKTATASEDDETAAVTESTTHTKPTITVTEPKITAPSVTVAETLKSPEASTEHKTKHEKVTTTTTTISSTANQKKKKRNWRFSGSESESDSSSSDSEILVSVSKKMKVDKFDSDNEEPPDNKEFVNKTGLKENLTTGSSNSTDTKLERSNNTSKSSTVSKKLDDKNSNKKPAAVSSDKTSKPKIREFDFCSTLTQSQQKYSSTTKLPAKKNTSTRDQRLLKTIVNGKKPGSVKVASNVLKTSSTMKTLSQSLKRPGPPKPKTVESLNNSITNHSSSPTEAKQNHKHIPAVADEAEKPPSSSKDSVLAAKFPLKRRALDLYKTQF